MEKFDPEFDTCDDAQLQSMLIAANAFVRDIGLDASPRWLSFLGTSGAGKTFLMKRIMRWWQRTPMFSTIVDTEAKVFVMPGAFYSWRKTAGMILEGDYSRVHDLCTEQFVVIDDIGAEYRDKAGIIKSVLDRIMDARVGKWTGLTCNYSLKQIGDEMDTRIASRMLRNNSVVIDVDVIDYNLRRK